MKSHSIWEFPVFWLVDTVVTWPKMRLWEISGLFETFGSDGSLQDTLKVSNMHNLKWNFLIPYLKLFLYETFLFEHATHLVFGFHRGRMCIFGDLDTIWYFLIPFGCLKLSLFETFCGNILHLNETFWLFYLKLFLNETFSYIKWYFCEITNNKQ